MPGIKCKCENIIKYGEIPNPNELLMISDVEYDNKFSGNIDSDVLYREMKSILVCNQCGRLWVYWDGFGNNPVSYFPEK